MCMALCSVLLLFELGKRETERIRCQVKNNELNSKSSCDIFKGVHVTFLSNERGLPNAVTQPS